MYTSKLNLIKAKLITFFMVLLIFIPSVSNASTVFNYQPQTKAEMIAYLYGRISQLLDMQKTLKNGGTISSLSNTFSLDYVTVATHKAIDIEETTAVLRGEVNLYGDMTASAWFEYGEDEDFLDQKTSKKSIRSVYDRAVRIQVKNLEDEKRYYFRLVTLSKDGSVSYGKIYGFRTDEADDD